MASISWLPAAASVASMVFGAAGADEASAAARENARRQKAADEFEAQQLEVNAGQQIAASQRVSMEEARQGRLVQSRAIAVAAAGGGSVADPTIVNILARTQNEASYRAGLALYQGEETAREMRMQAAAKRYEGDSAIIGGEAKARAYQTTAMANMFANTSTLARYGRFGSPTGGGATGDSALIYPAISEAALLA